MCLPRLGNRSSRLLRIVIYDGAFDGVPMDPASTFPPKNVRIEIASDESPV